MTSVFADYQSEMFPYRYAAQLTVSCIAGGTPADPNVAEGWLKTKLGADKDDLFRELVAEIALAQSTPEHTLSKDEAAKLAEQQKHLNGFKRDANGLYIEGRQVKAAIKEATSVAFAAGKILNNKGNNSWGKTGKGIHGFVAEHVMVIEDKIHLGVTEPTGINQRFVHTFRGSGIQYEEYVTDAVLDFTVETDYEFGAKTWAAIWTSGERQGVGASRSQGYGRYAVTRWERLDAN